jgi:hypothetical protein
VDGAFLEPISGSAVLALCRKFLSLRAMDIASSLNSFTDPLLWLISVGLLATIAFFLALAAMIQQRRARVQLTELQDRLTRLENAENRRVIQSLNRPTRARRTARKEMRSADMEAPARIVDAPRMGEDTEP